MTDGPDQARSVEITPVENRECCCSVEDGGTYCGQPECDIYYCQDCGDEFSEPCPRHEGVNHV